MNDLRDKEAEAFRIWFSSQNRFNSLSAMERALDITKDYLHLIRDGKRRAVDPDLRRKLFEATGLKVFEQVAVTHNETTVPPEEIETGANKEGSSPKTDEKNLPDDLRTQLRVAMDKLGLTLHEYSQKYEVSPNMLKKYKRGIAKPTSGKNVAAILNILRDANTETPKRLGGHIEQTELAEATDDFRVLTKEMSVLRKKLDQILLKVAEKQSNGTNEDLKEGGDAEERAKKTMRLLLNLSTELEFFKKCSEKERALFKKIVPGQDVGYITTLLRALYDEDKFQRWLLFSNYDMKGKDVGE